jgi:carbonyl reductase 1
MNQGRVAFVTGGNKGIGKEIARKLGCAGLRVVLGSQSVELGEAAAEELRAEGCTAECVHLELCDPASIQAAREFIDQKYGRLDVLVNNAAVCFNDATLYGACAYTPFEKQAGITVATNFFGTLDVTRAMLPLLQAAPAARLVTVASNAGRLAILRSQEKLVAFTAADLQVEQLESLMHAFVSDVEAGVHAAEGWPNTCYGLSKLGLIALNNILARDERQILVNCVDPGYCCTDQNANQGPTPAEEGARTPALLALLPDGSAVTGKYWYAGAEKAW